MKMRDVSTIWRKIIALLNDYWITTMTCLCGAPSDVITYQIWKFKIYPKESDQRTNRALENVLKLVLNSLGFLQHI